MATRKQFADPQFIIQQALINQQLGNHVKAISFLQYFVENQEQINIPVQILFLYLKSLFIMEEKVIAFTILSQFQNVDYISHRSEKDNISQKDLTTKLTLVYLDLFMELTNFHKDTYLSQISTNNDALIQFKEVYLKFLKCQSVHDQEIYQKVKNRLEIIQSYILLQIQLETTALSDSNQVHQKDDNILKQFKYLQLVMNIQFQSPKIIHQLLQELLFHVIDNKQNNLNEIILNEIRRLQQLLLTSNLHFQSAENNQNNCFDFVLLENEQQTLDINFKIIYFEFLIKNNDILLLLNRINQSIQECTSYNQIKLVTVKIFQTLILAAKQFTMYQQKQQLTYLILQSFILSLLNNYFTVSVKREYLDFFMEGQVNDFKLLFQSQILEFIQQFNIVQPFINQHQDLSHIWFNDENSQLIPKQFRTQQIGYLEYNESNRYLSSSDLSTVMLEFKSVNVNDLLSIMICIRKQLAEACFQTAIQYLNYNSSQQALQLLTDSIEYFPLKESFTALSRIYGKLGDQKLSQSIAQQYQVLVQNKQ